MATYDVHELFPGATIGGMDAAGSYSALPGSSEGIRSYHVVTYEDGAPPELQASVRKGFARTARTGALTAKLTQTPDGVRAQGTFGPDEDRGCCAVALLALFVLGMSIYLIITKHRATDFMFAGVGIAMLVFAGRLGRLLVSVNDDWNPNDLRPLLRELHRHYDGATTPAHGGGDSGDGAGRP